MDIEEKVKSKFLTVFNEKSEEIMNNLAKIVQDKDWHISKLKFEKESIGFETEEFKQKVDKTNRITASMIQNLRTENEELKKVKQDFDTKILCLEKDQDFFQSEKDTWENEKRLLELSGKKSLRLIQKGRNN